MSVIICGAEMGELIVFLYDAHALVYYKLGVEFRAVAGDDLVNSLEI